MKEYTKLAVLLPLLGGMTLQAQNVTTPGRTPVSDEINANMPTWLRFSGVDRVRMEYIVGEGFKPVADLYLLNRLRLNLDIRAARWLLFGFQAEDSRVFGQNTLPAPATQKDSIDLRQGWVQFGGNEGVAALRAGRQVLDFGDARLVGDPDWSNVGRTFDAARLTLRRGLWKVDLFTAASVKVDPLSFDEPVPAEHFDGAYGSIGGLIPKATIEPYLFWRLEHSYKSEAGKLGNLDEKTAGFRWAGKLPMGFDYTTEMALQTGSWAGDPIRAWMGHWVAGRVLADTALRPRAFVEFNRASGDANAKDGRHGTFDILFVSAHDKYGLTDLFCSSNIVHLRSGLQMTLRPTLTLSAAYSNFWLADAHDGLYVSGKVVARSATGSAGTHVGQEADIQAQWKASRSTQINVGYGRLFAGEFLQQTTSGVPYNLLYTGIAQRF